MFDDGHCCSQIQYEGALKGSSLPRNLDAFFCAARGLAMHEKGMFRGGLAERIGCQKREDGAFLGCIDGAEILRAWKRHIALVVESICLGVQRASWWLVANETLDVLVRARVCMLCLSVLPACEIIGRGAAVLAAVRCVTVTS